MRSIKAAIAGILALFVASAAVAQQFPTVPDHTAIGRVGTGSGSGPSQAIPFATLAGQLAPLITTAPLYAKDFGAACNGVNDDSGAFQALITAAIAQNRPARFVGDTAHGCRLASTLTIPNSIDFAGISSSDSTQAKLLPDATVNAISINASLGVLLHDFQIFYRVLPTQGSGITGITVTAPSGENGGSIFSNINVNGADFGIFFIKASGFIIQNSVIANFQTFGVVVTNTNNADSGDSTIISTSISTAASGSSAAIRYSSSGGLKISASKILTTPGSSLYGIQMALASGAHTGDLLVSNTSIENFSSAIFLARASTTGSFLNVVIVGNQLVGTLNCVLVPTDATGSWLANVIITGNTCSTGGSGSPIAWSIDSTNTVNIGPNATISNVAGTVRLNIGSAVTNCSLRGGPFSGSGFGADVITAGACIFSDVGLVSGASGGVPYFSAAGILAASAAGAANSFMTWGGAATAPKSVAITGLVLGNGASAPAAYAGTSGSTHQFITALSAAGVGTFAQPSTADVSTTINALVSGNGSVLGSYAGANCTNQAITALSALGAASCSSITNSFLTAGTFSNITGVGTLTAGATGAGFTVALGTSTITGTLAAANGGCAANTGAWTAFSPSVVATGGGGFTTASATGSYWLCGKMGHWRVTVTVTTKGAASGGVTIGNLPFTTNSTCNGYGSDAVPSAVISAIAASATTATFWQYNGNSFIAGIVNGNSFTVQATCEST